MKKWIWIVLAVVLLGGGYYFYNQNQVQQAEIAAAEVAAEEAAAAVEAAAAEAAAAADAAADSILSVESVAKAIDDAGLDEGTTQTLKSLLETVADNPEALQVVLDQVTELTQ